jgi:GNAT superfamily N-acetyltransferase
MVEIRPAVPEELPGIAELVGTVFAADAMLTWTSPLSAEPAAMAIGFFGAFHREAQPEGWIWVVVDGQVDGIAMWVPPDPHDRYARVMARIDGAVTELIGERKPRYDAFWAWIDEHRPEGPHWYLEHIAVEPERRAAGLGRALIEHGLARADADAVPTWLVTSKPGNVPMYERFGFEVDVDADAPEGGPHLWFMRRDPA